MAVQWLAHDSVELFIIISSIGYQQNRMPAITEQAICPPGPRRDHGSFCLAARPAPPDKKGRKVWVSGTSEHGHPKMKGKREKNPPTQPIGLSIMEGWPIVIRKDAYPRQPW